MKQTLGLVFTGAMLIAIGLAVTAPDRAASIWATITTVILQLAALHCFYRESNE